VVDSTPRSLNIHSPHLFRAGSTIRTQSPPPRGQTSVHFHCTYTVQEQLGAKRQFDAEDQEATPEVFIVVCCKIST
jgi:hypothetical protein